MNPTFPMKSGISSGEEKIVLCYGDSNTHGAKPDGTGRYAHDVRWTGILQKELGDEYYVIEEGLGGRTTNLEHPRTEKPMRNGLTYFKSCFESHQPIDVVIIMLGTNDLKNVYDRTPQQIATVLQEYCHFVSTTSPKTKVILVSPASIKIVEPIEFYDEKSVQKSKELAAVIRTVAATEQAAFYDANASVTVGADGVHWTQDSERRFASAIERAVRDVI